MKFKPLILSHLVLVLMLASFFWPVTRIYWDALDIACFKFLNGTLKGHPHWQLFWALANHKLMDWVEDVVFITFFVLSIRAAPKAFRLQRAAQFLFLILFAATTIYSVNRVFFRQNLDIPRDSPTLVVSSCTRLSDEIPWLHIKDDASSSFPGDHATTLLLFASGYAFYSGRKLGIYAWIYAIFRSLPRLIAGAHWFTDIAIGSTAITLFFLSWAFCTPFASFITRHIESFFRMFQSRQKSSNQLIE